MSKAGGLGPFWRYAGLEGFVAALGLVGALLLPDSEPARLGALVGTLAAAVSGAVALPLKRRAVAESMQAALVAMAAVFGLRVALAAAGLVAVTSRGAGPLAFTLGFFGVYLALQWLEIGYAVAERRRLGSCAS